MTIEVAIIVAVKKEQHIFALKCNKNRPQSWNKWHVIEIVSVTLHTHSNNVLYILGKICCYYM